MAEDILEQAEKFINALNIYDSELAVSYCNENVVYLEKEERHNLGLYSIHITGAVVLVIGWPVEISLTQLRSEAYEAPGRLRRLLAEE